ncbi:xylulokinase [Alkalicoccus halolimnae]|uniref:Xylulose kinase n=1 Tax=Alkalicoccus halolimnae TaxID=1667239 RepID=A0A5C7F0H1_9BACI|nr:xylulokinase [Alkalicoccus halolimnae]TXF82759.1 xylulokinase [Alkalicoccus halolimnae]
MSYVLGVDLGTSAVKVLLVGKEEKAVAAEASREYPLYHDHAGWSEQDPEDWVEATLEAIKEVSASVNDKASIEGISFAGQMHGLVLLDKNQKPLRRAMLWNDTRTTKQCREIEDKVGMKKLLSITKNPALEGFTLPKLLWVKQEEPKVFDQAEAFVLPKDYVRLRLTGDLAMEYSDAAGTLLFDISKKAWSSDICEAVGLSLSLCPPLMASHEEAGVLNADSRKASGLGEVRVFAGGADNACGAVGTGILEEGVVLSSTGTSGVVLAYEADAEKDFEGKVHYFNHGKSDAYYSMGVTLAAGHSFSWFKETFAPDRSFEELLKLAEQSPPGANGLLFTPYISGERTPHADADVRGSFIGMHASHTLGDFTRAVIEGITFSLQETMSMFKDQGKQINKVIATGGGAKSDLWLQIQSDIYNSPVVKLKSEQGPGLGAAMIAAYSLGWYPSLKAAADIFVEETDRFEPDEKRAETYENLFSLYQQVYSATKNLNGSLKKYR